MENVTATIQKTLFQTAGEYFVVGAEGDDGETLRLIFKRIQPPRPGNRISLTGFMKTHPRYGEQFHVQDWGRVPDRSQPDPPPAAPEHQRVPTDHQPTDTGTDALTELLSEFRR